MPMPSNNSPRNRQNREFTVSNPVVQSEDGIPVSTSNPTFTFPSRNSSATQPSTTYSPPITISPPPPNIHLDSQSPKPTVSNTTPDDSADQKSFKSGISKTSISTTQREFEQVVKLRDEDESESSETKGSNLHGTSASGVPFWRRSFSRPASIHELQDHAAIGTSASTSSITAAGSSLLPKLSLFKRRSNSDLVGAVAMGAISTSGNTNSSSNSSNAAPNSPIAMPSPVSTVMKGFWPMKSSASSAANRGADTDPLVKREDSDTSNRVTDLLASVPTLGLPKVSKKSDKKKASAAANAGASTTTATAIEKTEKVKEPSRFWPSTANANQAPKSPTQSKKGKAAATKQPQIKASDTRRASVDSNHVDGGTGSIASSNTSGSKLFWSKPKTPSISYAKAVAKTDESNVGQSASSGVKVPVVSVNVEDDSQNWLDVDDHHSRSSDQSTSWDRNVLSRFKWQTKSKSGNFLKSFNNGADSRSMSPSTGGTPSKLFGLRKRASNETMKSEFLRMATTPPAPVEELIDDGYSQEYATTNNSSSFFPSLRISTPQFLISDFDNIPLQRDPSNRYNNQFEQRPQQYQSFQQPQQQSHQQQQNDFNSPITPNRLYESDDNLSWNDFQSRRNPKNVEPIHRPNSGKTRSIASAPGSNLKRSSSVVSLNESTLTREVSPSSATVPGGGFGGGSSGTTGESTLYSPFFSGLEIPMTQRPTGSISSATSSFHLDTSSSLNGSSSKSHRSKHHHYHHHHHFYHFPAAGGAITVEGGNGNSGGPVNLPLVNVQQQSEEFGVSFRRLRKLSHDAGLYGQNQQAIHDQYVPGDSYRDTVRAHDGLSNASGVSSIAYGASKLGTRSSGSTIGSYVTVADENVETGGLPTVGE
ncbi:hypothetical protein BDR26DRAFT_900239 [Obelidium mucronatum]|nr:hypothetical protein BDR26DRAFT_900239 [Obelidium mucronatum]